MDRDREKDREKDREIEEKPADISDICLEAPLPPENILTSHSVYAPPIVSAPPSERAPQSSAPTLRDPEQTRREEKNILVLSGIPLEYINEREERAEEFARKQKRSFVSVFREWWEKDKAHYEWKRESTSPSVNGAFHSKEKSYDTDAFFEAALKKSYDEFDRRYGKEGS